jgi:hypothetical protein
MRGIFPVLRFVHAVRIYAARRPFSSLPYGPLAAWRTPGSRIPGEAADRFRDDRAHHPEMM